MAIGGGRSDDESPRHDRKFEILRWFRICSQIWPHLRCLARSGRNLLALWHPTCPKISSLLVCSSRGQPVRVLPCEPYNTKFKFSFTVVLVLKINYSASTQIVLDFYTKCMRSACDRQVRTNYITIATADGSLRSLQSAPCRSPRLPIGKT